MSEFVKPPRFSDMLARYRAAMAPVPRDEIVARLMATRNPALAKVITDYKALPDGSLIPRGKVASDILQAITRIVDGAYMRGNMSPAHVQLPNLVDLWAEYRCVEVTVSSIITELVGLGEPAATDPIVRELRGRQADSTILIEQVAEMLLARMMTMVDAHRSAGARV